MAHCLPFQRDQWVQRKEKQCLKPIISHVKSSIDHLDYRIKCFYLWSRLKYFNEMLEMYYYIIILYYWNVSVFSQEVMLKLVLCNILIYNIYRSIAPGQGYWWLQTEMGSIHDYSSLSIVIFLSNFLPDLLELESETFHSVTSLGTAHTD